MDEKDRKIIDLLSENSRMAYTKIAEEIGISETAVRKRISNLEDEGVIKNYTIDVDPSKLGYDVVSITGINTEPENFLSIAEDVKRLKEVRDVKITSGDHTLMANIWAKSGEELSRIISEEIGEIEGVKKVFPAIILEEV
ncbi:MAG: Lrp/AsnC family transcriptional regulator [Candidatus Nanohaloarchaeota archaeon QJJ-9]|nr:Lrp/AsnC family transcriptional regulator [Candidatus Nanohaloarchaeota archaeon QJJ-9]